jgi:hypothetical protein
VSRRLNKRRKYSDLLCMLKSFLVVLSIYLLSASFAHANWTVRSANRVVVGKQSLRAGQKLPRDMQIQSFGGTLSLQRGTEVWDFKFYKNAILKISQEHDEKLRGHLISGEIRMIANKRNTQPFVLTVGDWELRKFYGTMRVQVTNTTRKNSGSSTDLIVRNEEQALWIKKDEFEPSQEVPGQIQFEIQDENSIFAFEPIAGKQKMSGPWSLESRVSKTKGQRKVASVESPLSDKSLCGSPSGQFQQCAWKCFGSKRNKGCDTGQVNTHCVRFTCTADGHWKMPTLVPGGACPLTGMRVDQCQ